MELSINEREITPKLTWLNGEDRILNVFKLDSFRGYDFAGNGGIVHWTLFEIKYLEVQAGEGENVVNEIVENKTAITAGEVQLPQDLVSTWGEDDEPIFQYVMQKINVTSVKPL